MVPNYSNTMRIRLQNRLFSTNKLWKLHKIALTSWVYYENDSNYILGPSGYAPIYDEGKYYVGPTNAFLYDYGILADSYINSRTNIERVSISACYLVRGNIKEAHNYFNQYGIIPKITVRNYPIQQYSPFNSNIWWKNQKKIFQLLKQYNI